MKNKFINKHKHVLYIKGTQGMAKLSLAAILRSFGRPKIAQSFFVGRNNQHCADSTSCARALSRLSAGKGLRASSTSCASCARALSLLGVFVILGTMTFGLLASEKQASAATSNTLNFQGRLLTATGGLVPDGTYNMQFNLYYVSTAGSTLWTETRTNQGANPVTIQNGYYSVYLGDTTSGGTAFPTNIDWSQDLYLGMTVRGTGTCAFGACTPTDSEMTPRFKLTAVPYAFRASNVASSSTNAASTDSDDVSISTGNALGATSNSGDININVGSATGTRGAINIGTGASAPSSILIGQSGTTTTLQGAALFQGNITLQNTGYLATQAGTDVSTTGNLDNLNFGTASLVRFTGASTQTIRGLANGADGRILTIVNAAAQALVINNEDANSTAGNRIVTGTGSALSIPAGSSISLIYDATATRWRVSGSAAATGGVGVNTVGAIDSQTKSANGAVISGTSIYLQNADVSNVGLVSIGSQTFNGVKTFDDGAVITTGGLTISAGALAVNSDSITSDGATLTIDAAGTVAITDALTVTGTISDTDSNLILDDTVDIGSATTGLRVATSGSLLDIDGNLILDDQTDIGSTTTGLRVTTAGLLSDIDGNVVIGDTVDLGSATTGLRVSTTGDFLDIDGNLVLNDTVDIGSATTGLNVTTAGVLSDIDGTLTVTDAVDINVNANNAVNINTGTSTGLVTIGGGSGTFSLQTTNIDISSAGAISGVTGYTQTSGAFAFSGGGNFSVDSAAFDVNTSGAVSGVTSLTLSGAISGGTSFTGSGNINTTAGAFQLNGTDINTAGTLTNVAYENQANTFTAANIFQGNITLQNTGYLATQAGTDVSTTGNLDNLNFGTASLVRFTGASTQTIRGLANGADGRILTIVNAAAQALVINNEDANSTAGNRIVTGTGSALSIPAGSSISLIYDATATRWRVSGSAAATGGVGVNTVGAIDSQTKSANGAVISGTSIYLQNADVSNVGLVSIGSQTFNGVKTFDDGAVITTGGLTISAGALAVNSDSITSDGATLTIDAAGTVAITDALTVTGTISDTDSNLILDDTVDIGSATTGLRVATSGSLLDIDGNLILDDQTDIGSTTTGLRVTTAGLLSDIDGNVVIGDTVDLGSATTGLRVSTTGDFLDIDGNLVLNDTVDIGSATTGLNVTTAGVLSDIDGTLTVTDAVDINVNANNAVNINTGTSTGLVTIGGGSGTFSLQTTNIDISSAGAISGVTGYTQTSGAFAFSGGGNFSLDSAGLDVSTAGALSGITGYSQTSGNFSQSGSGTFGTGTGVVSLNGNTNIAATASLATQAGTTYTTAGSANNVAISTASLYRLDTSGAAQTITGIAAGRDGQILTLVNADASLAVTLSNLSGSSSAANRISTGTGTDITIAAGATSTLIYDATSSLWRVVGDVAGGTGLAITTVGAIDSQTKSANGAVIASNTIYLQTADATNVGLVSTGTQTLAGAKTFSSLLTGSAGATISGGAIALTGNAASSFTTSSGALTLTSAAAATWSTSAGNLTVDSAAALNLGTTNATGVTIGSTSATTAVALQGTTAATYTIGSNATTGTITIGGTAQTGNIVLGSSSGTNTVAIGNGTGATTVNIANNNTAGAVNIGAALTTGTITIGGTGAQTGTIALGTGTGVQSINLGTGGTGAKTVTLGSTASSSATTIQSGTGNLNITTQGTGSLNVGNNAVAQTINVGNTTGATALNLRVGTGNFSLDGVAGSTYALGASTTTGTITIGGTAQTGNIVLGSSSGTNSVLIGNGAGATTVNIANSATAGAVNIGAAMTTGTITIGGTGAQTGTIALGTGTGVQTINLATGGTGAKTVTLGSTASTSSLTLQSGTGVLSLQTQGTGGINIGTNAVSQNITIGNSTGGTLRVGQNGGTVQIDGTNFDVSTAGVLTLAGSQTSDITTAAASTATNITVKPGNSTGSNAAGATLTLQGGNATSGNANGGNVLIAGGTGVGSGVKGLVVIDTPTYSTASSQNCAAADCTITQANVDGNGAVIVTFSSTGYEAAMPDPTIATAGRVVYVTAANGASDFTLCLNDVTAGGSYDGTCNTTTGNTISMRANTTATLIWNGSDWTAAGASSSTDLQAAYNNTLSSAGGAEIVLNNSATSDGLTVRNNASNPIIGALFEAQTSVGSNLFSINNNAVEYASNGGSETAGGSSTTFPSSTWSQSPNGGTQATISRTITTGEFATGVAAAKVVTTGATTANQGIANQISTPVSGVATNVALTNNLAYTVSFTVKGTANFSTLDVVYSRDGTNTSTTACATGRTVTQSVWTRINCDFVVPSSGVTTSNAIFIRQSDSNSVARTFYIDNLSVTINSNTNHAADGTADVAGSMGATSTFNWVAINSATVAQTTSTIYDTNGAVSVTTSATAGRGVYNRLSNNIAPPASSTGTQYRVSFYARGDGTNTATLAVAYSPDNGSSTISCQDYNTQIALASSYTLISCLFTNNNTAVTTAQLRITQSSGSATVFYVDALTVTLNTSNANNVQIGGANEGGPVTLFTLDRSSGAPIAENNDAYLGSMYYDTSSGRIQCYEADGWGACGGAPDNIVNLNPEYAGAVLNGAGVGTMTADFCSNDGALSVNSTLCGTGVAKNYYRWTSPQATQQTYSIYVSYQLPSTFASFASDDTVQLVARTDSTTNAAVTYQMFKSIATVGSEDVVACGSETTVVTVANTWQSVGINGNEATTCTFNANDFVIFKINMKANSGANAYASTLSFTTTGR